MFHRYSNCDCPKVAPQPHTKAGMLSSVSDQIKQLDDLDTILLNVEVSQLLIGCGRINAMPLQCFLHPSVMCRAHTEGLSNSLPCLYYV